MRREQQFSMSGWGPEPGPEPHEYITGKTFAWGSYRAGWAIWFRDRPDVVLERFSAEDRLQSFRRFKVLDSRSESRARRVLHAVGRRSTVLVVLAGALLVLVVAGVTELLSVPPSAPQGALGISPGSPTGVTERAESREQPPRDPSRGVGDPASLPGVGVYANRPGGYLFSYPDAWALNEAGASAELISPDGHVVVEFGAAPAGGLGRASQSLVRELANPYHRVQLLRAERERTEQGLRTAVVGGTATDPRAEGAQFLAIAIKGFSVNHAISVRFSSQVDVLETLPAIRSIVSSYRVSETV